jgi:hypothetical protein
MHPDSGHEGGWGGSERVRVAVLWCAVAGADDVGRLRWPELMVEAACMHVWAPRSSTHADGDAPSSDPRR